ncbi:MAG: hypothetical protein CVU95_14475 [Firmicutes bacterium HGW-Firmicutes-2]|jgi:hypothetical protein|nr:MAG: hypothetical protein CVU95_14475 [Firmicutes bacterium HGW-Firmicutes-2]
MIKSGFKLRRFFAGLCLLMLLTGNLAWANIYDATYRPDMAGEDWWWPVTEFQLPTHWWISDELQGFNKFNDSWITFGGEYGSKTVNEGWNASAVVQMRFVESTDSEHIFDSSEDFLARGFLEGTDLSWLMSGQAVDIDQVSETTLNGYQAYLLESEMRVADDIYTNRIKEWAYFLPTDEGGILVLARAIVDWSIMGDFDPNWDRGEHFSMVIGEVEGVLGSLQFRGSNSGPTTGQDVTTPAGNQTGEEEEGGLPWVTVVGGLVSVAAVGVAIAGTKASSKASNGNSPTKEEDPNKVVGYALNISDNQLSIQEDVGAALTIGIYEIYADGHTKPVAGNIDLSVPTGVGVQPASGISPLNTVVWQASQMSTKTTMTISASYGGGGMQAVVELIPVVAHRLSVTFEPVHKRHLITTGRDHITLVAQVLWPDPQSVSQNSLLSAKESIKFAVEDKWLALSAAVDWEEGKAVNVVASSPDPTSNLTPPDKGFVKVTAQVDGKLLSQTVGIEIAPLPVFELSQDKVSLDDGGGQSSSIRGWIERGLDVQWQFSHFWRQGHKALAEVVIEPESGHSFRVQLTGQSLESLDPSRPVLASTLRLVASSEEYGEIERHLEVIVAREGLFIDTIGQDPLDHTFHIEATGQDKPTRIDVRVYVRDETGAVQLSTALSEAVLWEPCGEDPSPGLTALRFPEFECRLLGLRRLEQPSATFEMKLNRKLPTSGDPINASMRAYIPDLDEDLYAKIVPLSLIGVNLAPFSDAWLVEKEACLTMIHDYAPKDMKERLFNLVAEKGVTIGVDGLYELRTRIWRLSENAYRKEAADWMDYAWTIQQIEDTLDWVSWCGDIAFSVASGRITGTAAGIAIGMLKPVLVSAITAYVEGKSMEDWAYEQLGMVLAIAEGQWTDPDFIQKLSGASKAKIWAAFIAYTFIKNWAMEPQHSIVKAMENTARMLRDQALVSFLRRVAGTTPQAAGPDDKPLNAKTKTSGSNKINKVKPAKLAPEFEGVDPQTRADKMSKKIKEKISKDSTGKPKIDVDTMEKIMRDPDGARVLKKTNPEAWEAYHNTRKEVYKNHDDALKKWVKKHVPDMEGENIEVRNVGTDDGIDRDYRVGMVKKDPITGREVFVEIPKEKWQNKSGQLFSEQVGGPTNPAEALEYAQSRQQLGTDGYHSEAAIDMADQTTVKDPKTGKWVKTQKTPNVDLVKDGKRTLADPDGLGKTYETKVANAYYTDNKLDAYTQAAKAKHTLEGVQEGYIKQGYKVKAAPPEIKKGLDIIDQVAKGQLKPEAADIALRDAGLGSDLPGFMEKVSGQFSSLKQAKK